MWLWLPIYTVSPSAMAMNNLGACYLLLGEAEEATQWLDRALALDPLYPLPYFNRAVMHEMAGRRQQATADFEISRDLGYSAGKLDAVIHKSQSILARLEGRDSSV